MSGWLTDGVAQASVANGNSFPFSGNELIPLDTQLANGQAPQTVSASTAQLLGVLPSAPVNTAYAATLTIDGANGLIQTVGTLTGAVTISWKNIVPGLQYKLKLVQDGSGSRAATLTGGSTTWKVSGSQSTTASYVDWLSFWFDGTTYWGLWNTHFA